MREPLVVLDLTPLDTDDRLRGYGRYVATLARGLASLPDSERAGLRLCGLTRFGWDGSYRLVDRLDSWTGEVDVKKNPGRLHYELAYKRRLTLAIALRRMGASLLHLPTPNGTPLGMWASGCKKLVTCHDLIDLRWPEQYQSLEKGGRLLGPAILKRRYASADHVLAISDESANDLQRFFGIERAKVTRVYNAIDHAKWTPDARATDGDTVTKRGLVDGRYLIYVGDLDWRKNLEGMLFGLANARKSVPDVTLALCGKLSDDKLARVRATAEQAGVSDAIQLLGYVPDDELAALYRRSLGHLFVSRDEGFGLTVLEAMACGAPVITTNSGSLREVAGDDALLCDPEDHAAIGRAIVQLARDPGVASRLRPAGIARAARFSIDRQARETLAIYRRMLGL